MDIAVDFEGIGRIFEQAAAENRGYLYEYEVYEVIALVGSETPPEVVFFPKGDRLKESLFSPIPGERIVIKIVSPYILHKSEVGGVEIVPKDTSAILSAVRRMLSEIPERYARIIRRDPGYAPEVYRGLTGDALTAAVSRDIKGVIFCRYMPPDSQEFGNELIVSLRRTREFGMVITAGLGGTDTELYAERLKKGQAVVSAATEMIDGETFFRLFKETISYKKLAGLTRGRTRVVTDGQLLECFSAVIAVGNRFSPLNPETRFVIEELEINPFAFTNYLMVPLDGLCSFSLTASGLETRPLDKIGRLFHPSTIGLVGVSARRINVGRIILDNILANGFDPAHVRIVHPSTGEIAGVATVPSLESLEKVDLMVLTVEAAVIPDLIQVIIDRDLAESVLLISAGVGETSGSESIMEAIQDKLRNARRESLDAPVLIGGNSLGIISHPGRYDTLFIPEEKMPRHRGIHVRDAAFISQSGAFMITRMSRRASMDPAYACSIGNQIDVSAGDLLTFLNTRDEISVICCYMEGFTPLDGLTSARAVREAVLHGKDVIFYKAGRTPEGKSATSGHTASIAGDYMVSESCLRQAGAMLADSFATFEGLFRVARNFKKKTIYGNRLAAISNAGFESVGFADNIHGDVYNLELAPLGAATVQRIRHIIAGTALETLVEVKNPLDVTPMTTEKEYELLLGALFEDPQVDVIVAGLIPLAPLMQTSPGIEDPGGYLRSEHSIVQRIAGVASRFDKPLVMVLDSGPEYAALEEAFKERGLTVFRSSDQAVKMIGRYVQGRLNAQMIAGDIQSWGRFPSTDGHSTNLKPSHTRL